MSLRRYYAANAPVYQVDILDTTTMTFVGGESLFGHLCFAIEWGENVSSGVCLQALGLLATAAPLLFMITMMA